MIDKKKIFRTQFPKSFYFDEDNMKNLPSYLKEKGLVSPDERVIATEKPGEGNMNFVRRVITNRQTFILKQSRPWVEKYPQIEAPPNRIEVEARYYQFISTDQFLSNLSPGIIFFDPENLILISQDLGKGSDFTECYDRSYQFEAYDIDYLLIYINHLHNKEWTDQVLDFPKNLELRTLNHEHIFNFPYLIDNEFDLDQIQPGLQDLSIPIKREESLKNKIKEFGKTYLSSGSTLIHGDYYPGSWLKISNEVKVIDPEFAFFGNAEFDIGVMTAHFLMAHLDLSDIKHILGSYERRQGFDADLFYGFCGTEILRRIIGLAQLPLDLSLNEKDKLLDLAQEFITSPNSNKLL